MKTKIKFLAMMLMGILLSVNVWGEIATGTYVLCTSTSDLKAGDHYIIANGTSGSVNCISNVSNNNNRKVVSATVTDSEIEVASDATTMTLTLGGTSGAWTFATDNYAGTDGYLASAGSGDNNYCRVISTSTTATISFSNGAAVINLQPHESRTLLRYNSSVPCFACYSSGQDAVYLYHKSDAPAHTITAQSNNVTYGTVSLNGSKITASPKTGYTYASPAYTVTNGTATVVQDGNVFTVTPETDCTVRINFAAKQTATITLMEAGTPVAGPNDKYSGDSYTLPSSVTNVCEDKTFVGWSTVELPTEGGKPTENYYAKGAEVTLAVTNTFYAVYADAEESNEVFYMYYDNSGTKTYVGAKSGDYLSALTNKNDAVLYTIDADGYLSYTIGETTTYITHTQTGETKVATGKSQQLTITKTESTIQLRSQKQNTRYLQYASSGGGRFQFTASDATLSWEPSVSYSNYTTCAAPVRISWRVQSDQYAEDEINTQVTIVPANPNPAEYSCGENAVFVGWTTSDNYSNHSTAPTPLYKTEAEIKALVLTEDITFYAVFATKVIN